jgi:hypothetical protein
MSEPGRGVAVGVWIALLLLLSLGALVGGGALMARPDGNSLGVPSDLLVGTPFRDYLIPGTLLFVFLGVYPAVVSFALWRRPEWKWPDRVNPFRGMHWAWTAGLSVGVVLIVWIVSEEALIGCCHPLQHLYLGWGILVLVMGGLPGVRARYVRQATAVAEATRRSG